MGSGLAKACPYLLAAPDPLHVQLAVQSKDHQLWLIPVLSGVRAKAIAVRRMIVLALPGLRWSILDNMLSGPQTLLRQRSKLALEMTRAFKAIVENQGSLELYLHRK